MALYKHCYNFFKKPIIINNLIKNLINNLIENQVPIILL